MKRLFMYALQLIVLSMVFAGCSKDDDLPQITLQEIKSQLIGEWTELGYIKGEVFKEEAKFGNDGTFSYWFFNGWGNTERVNGKWNLKDDKTISITDEDGKTTDYYFTYELDSFDKKTISNIYISPLFRFKLYK